MIRISYLQIPAESSCEQSIQQTSAMLTLTLNKDKKRIWMHEFEDDCDSLFLLPYRENMYSHVCKVNVE